MVSPLVEVYFNTGSDTSVTLELNKDELDDFILCIKDALKKSEK